MEMNPIKSSSSDLLPPHMLELNNKNWWFINLVVCLLLHSLILFFPLSEWRCSDLSSSLVNLFEKSRIAVPLKCDFSFCSDLVSAALFFKGNTFHLTSGIWQDLLHPLFHKFISMALFSFFSSMFSEGRLANAQAGMCLHVHFWAELATLRDCEANSKNPCQTGEQKVRLGMFAPALGAREGRKMKTDQQSLSLQSTHTHTSPVYRQV